MESMESERGDAIPGRAREQIGSTGELKTRHTIGRRIVKSEFFHRKGMIEMERARMLSPLSPQWREGREVHGGSGRKPVEECPKSGRFGVFVRFHKQQRDGR